MSFINRSKSNQVMSQAPLKKASNVEMRIDVVPIPTASHVAVKREGQTQASHTINMLGGDRLEVQEVLDSVVEPGAVINVGEDSDLGEESVP